MVCALPQSKRRPAGTFAQSGLKRYFLSGQAKPFDVMRRLEVGLRVDPLLLFQLGERPPAGLAQGRIDDLARRHVEARMRRAEPLGQRAHDVVVRAALARRLDQLQPERDVLVAAALIDVVVLQEHGRGQDDVGHLGRRRHELLVHDGEQIVARKTLLDEALLGADLHGVLVLNEERADGRTAAQIALIAIQDRADAAHVEHADAVVPEVVPLDQRLVPMIDAAVVVEGAAALVQPRAGHAGDRHGRVHVVGAVALARETVAEPQERLRRRTDHAGERLDLLDRQAR